jgi:deazaflavin-dependent oxidoreductase (nitroreductase family)
VKRRLAMVFWRAFNPIARRLAGIAPWWVVLETTGRRSGRTRLTPLARGPEADGALWLISVHGRRASWVKNLEASPSVRLRVRGRWRAGTASVVEWDAERVRSFNAYARMGPRTLGIDPVLVRVDVELSA